MNDPLDKKPKNLIELFYNKRDLPFEDLQMEVMKHMKYLTNNKESYMTDRIQMGILIWIKGFFSITDTQYQNSGLLP